MTWEVLPNGARVLVNPTPEELAEYERDLQAHPVLLSARAIKTLREGGSVRLTVQEEDQPNHG